MATYTKDKDVETVLEDDTEARKAMQEVKTLAQELRLEVQETKNTR